ncbi:Ulp1 protease family [Entamoeba marina]
MKQSSVVASFQGVTLYQCDYNLIQSGWNIYIFRNKILLLDPLTFIMLSFSPNASLLDDYDVKSYEYIIITVNDFVDNNTPNNGSHWTLLLCDITQQKVYSYVSVPSHSYHHVNGLLLKLNKYFSKKLSKLFLMADPRFEAIHHDLDQTQEKHRKAEDLNEQAAVMNENASAFKQQSTGLKEQCGGKT